MQQRPHAEDMAVLAVQAELATQHQAQYGDVQGVQVIVFGGLAVDGVQHGAAAPQQRIDHRADHLASLLAGFFWAAA